MQIYENDKNESMKHTNIHIFLENSNKFLLE